MNKRGADVTNRFDLSIKHFFSLFHVFIHVLVNFRLNSSIVGEPLIFEVSFVNLVELEWVVFVVGK
jgi:hypothetical protein